MIEYRKSKLNDRFDPKGAVITMKKRILLLIACLIASAMLFIACTDEKESDGKPKDDTTDSKNEIEEDSSGGDNSGNTDDGDSTTEDGTVDKDATDDAPTEDDTTEDETESGDNEDESVTVYPPSESNDPYENDKHWQLP